MEGPGLAICSWPLTTSLFLEYKEELAASCLFLIVHGVLLASEKPFRECKSGGEEHWAYKVEGRHRAIPA